jgi:hypothetical protein
VHCTALDNEAAAAAELAWREIYGEAFVGRPRARQGFKAEHAYKQETCLHFLVIPFTSKITGLPAHALGTRQIAYECRGTLVPLGSFHNVEFFVSPVDFSWTMVHTHEDHGYGGPYFIRRDWLS